MTPETPVAHPIDESAPAVVRLATTVHASLAHVWALHTDVAAWPEWNPDITRAESTGPLAAGAVFRRHTHGLDITSTVLELLPGRRIVRGGPEHGIDGFTHGPSRRGPTARSPSAPRSPGAEPPSRPNPRHSARPCGSPWNAGWPL
ncbi:SRPBCC family protein [Streptomyces sp. OE57]|uniref:SRPBCC family protein n=1 Tax=Streptomyces lacaronensis TaxID=3379885 RepID=UPI0039B73893